MKKPRTTRPPSLYWWRSRWCGSSDANVGWGVTAEFQTCTSWPPLVVIFLTHYFFFFHVKVTRMTSDGTGRKCNLTTTPPPPPPAPPAPAPPPSSSSHAMMHSGTVDADTHQHAHGTGCARRKKSFILWEKPVHETPRNLPLQKLSFKKI